MYCIRAFVGGLYKSGGLQTCPVFEQAADIRGFCDIEAWPTLAWGNNGALLEVPWIQQLCLKSLPDHCVSMVRGDVLSEIHVHQPQVLPSLLCSQGHQHFDVLAIVLQQDTSITSLAEGLLGLEPTPLDAIHYCSWPGMPQRVALLVTFISYLELPFVTLTAKLQRCGSGVNMLGIVFTNLACTTILCLPYIKDFLTIEGDCKGCLCHMWTRNLLRETGFIVRGGLSKEGGNLERAFWPILPAS